jgi:hypothetical protein
MPTANGRLKKGTKLPAGTSYYTLFRWTSKQEELKELAAVTRAGADVIWCDERGENIVNIVQQSGEREDE